MDERFLGAVLEDLARAVDSWAATAGDILTNPEADLDWAEDDSGLAELRGCLPSASRHQIEMAMREIMQGLMHSTLAVFDGATQSAEIGEIKVVDQSGEPVQGALHELFVGHLFDTGRKT